MGLACWLLALIKKEIKLAYDPNLKILNYLFIGYLVFSISNTIFFENGLIAAIKSIFSVYIQWFWFTSSLAATNKTDELKIAQGLALSGTIFALLVLAQVLNLAPSPDTNIFGIQKQPFTSSALLLFSLFTSLYCLEQSSRKTWYELRRFYFISFALELLALFSLGQRSTIIGTILGIVIYVIAARSLNLKQKLLSFTSVAAALFIAAVSSERFYNKFSKILNPSALLGSNSMQCRLDLWQQNLDHWLLNQSNSLWIGSGTVIALNCMGSKLIHMHNIFLQQLVRKGIIGFGLWLSFYLWSLIELISRKSSTAFIAAFIAISVEGLFENWWGDSEVLSGFLFMLSLALISARK